MDPQTLLDQANRSFRERKITKWTRVWWWLRNRCIRCGGAVAAPDGFFGSARICKAYSKTHYDPRGIEDWAVLLVWTCLVAIAVGVYGGNWSRPKEKIRSPHKAIEDSYYAAPYHMDD